jgi:chaperone modulatory protein CbpM
MNQADTPVHAGNIFEETAVLSVDDLCRLCAIEARRVIDLVEEGVLSVAAAEAAVERDAQPSADVSRWRFSGVSVRRTRIAMRLQRDLEINLAGVALALDLMDEVERLRRALRRRGG